MPTAQYQAPQPQVQRTAPAVIQQAAPARPVQRQAAPSASGIFLQAGSFSSQRDANTHRAKVLLQGLKASVQSVSINGQPRYRVIIGPLDNRGYNRASDRLNRAGIAHFVTR